MKRPCCWAFGLVCVLLSSTNCFAGTWFVGVNGSSSGNGSFLNPWSLSYALARPSSVVLPGDTIFLRRGTYIGPFTSSIAGTAAAPTTIANYPNERPVLLGNSTSASNQVILTVNGQYANYLGLEITSNPVTRISAGSVDPPTDIYSVTGMAIYGVSVKIINCIIHNCPGGGMGYWSSSLESEVYGCLIYDNGYKNTVRGHGPNIYVQNNNENRPKSIVNSFIFNGFSLGIQFYSSSSDVLRGLTIDSCTVFNSGANTDPAQAKRMNLLAGGANNSNAKVRNLKVANNLFYRDTTDNAASTYVPYSSYRKNVELGTEDETLTDAFVDFHNNYLYGDPTPLLLHTWDSGSFHNNFLYAYASKANFNQYVIEQVNNSAPFVNWDSNAYYTNEPGFTTPFSTKNFQTWKTSFGVDEHSTYSNANPNFNVYQVRPNKYEPNKYYVTVQNYLGQNQVSLPFVDELLPGTSYAVYDVQYSTSVPVDTGTYNGDNISLPMNQTAVAPLIGLAPVQPKHTSKTLGTFIIEFYPESTTVKNGDWNDASVWSSGKVPSYINRIKVVHNITVPFNAWCRSIKVLPGGSVTVKACVLLNAGKQ